MNQYNIKYQSNITVHISTYLIKLIIEHYFLDPNSGTYIQNVERMLNSTNGATKNIEEQIEIKSHSSQRGYNKSEPNMYKYLLTFFTEYFYIILQNA